MVSHSKPVEFPLCVLIADRDDSVCRSTQRVLEADPDLRTRATTNGMEAVRIIKKYRPDIMLLDLQMPDLDSDDCVELIPMEERCVLFMTDAPQHALKAFEVHATDCILKPFSNERLKQAVQRAKARIVQTRTQATGMQLLRLLQQAASVYVDRLPVKREGRFHLLKTSDIDWIEATKGKYLIIHAGGKEYKMPENLKMLEPDLNPRLFVRIHKSTIVNIDRIKEIESLSHGDCHVRLADGTCLTLSRRYRKNFQRILGRPF